MKNKSLVFVFFASAFTVFGQNTDSTHSKWSIFWHPGSNWDFQRSTYTGLDDFAPYVLNSNLKPGGYEPEYIKNNRVSGTSIDYSLLNFGVQYDIGKWFAKSEKISFSVRSSVNYLGNLISARSQEDFDQILIDSTYNAEYDVLMQRDSIHSESYYASISSKTIRWQNEFVVRRQLSKRFKVIYGIGLGATFKFENTFLLSESKASYEFVSVSNGNQLVEYNTDPYYGQYYPEYNNVSNSGAEPKTNEQQAIGLPNEMGGLAYVPLSLEFTLGKKVNVLSRMHIYFEGQFGVRWEKDNFGDIKNTFLLNHGFGFRFQI